MIIDSPIISGSSVASGSYTQTGNVTITGSLIVTGGITGSISGSAISASYATTASYASNVPVTASYANNATSASYAASASNALNAVTASYLTGYISPFPYTGSAAISGSLTVNGPITATTLIVQTITASQEYSSGSNIFGNNISNTQVFTGSVIMTGSLAVTGAVSISGSTGNLLTANVDTISFTGSFNTSGSVNIVGGVTASLLGTASYATTASYWSGSITNATSASYALSASYAVNSTTASYVANAQTASYVATAQTASFIATASYASNANLLDGLDSTAFATTGSNQFNGNQTVTGSILTSGNIQTTSGYVQTSLLYNGGAMEIRSFYQPLQVNSNGAGIYLNDNVSVSSSLTITGSLNAPKITGSLLGTASYATTASYWSGSITNALSASYAASASNALAATSASYALTASYSANVPVTASYANNAASSSYALTASYSANVPVTSSYANNAATASYSLTSSYSLSGGGFPYSGSAVITGSLLISNLGGTGSRYLVTDASGNITAQTASALIINNQVVTASAGQTSFTITNGYTTGLIETYINGTKLIRGSEFTDTNGTTIVLATGSFSNDIVEFVIYSPASGVANNALRQVTYFTASAGQTIFSTSYTPGLLDIFYNGSKLDNSEYTATNGTSFALATASNAGDKIEVDVYSYQVGAFSSIGGTGVANQFAYFTSTNAVTSSNAITLSGSNAIITGSLLGTASFATSASYATYAETLDGLDSTVFTLTSSFNAQTASFNAFSASHNSFTASIFAQTASFNAFSASINTTTSSFSGRVGALEAYTASQTLRNTTYATTGSNTFVGTQYISNTNNAIGFSNTTSSIYTDGGLQVTKDAYISSSLYIKGNLTVYGTQSVSYITSSTLNISTNLITVNTSTPSVRFGGLAVQDSGSASGLTGSLLWDSQNNSWLYDNPSGSGNYDSAMVIMGPRNSSTLGSEQGLNCNYLVQGHGHHHTTSSAIFHDGTNTCIPNTLAGNTIYASTLAYSPIGCFDTLCANNLFPYNISMGNTFIRAAGNKLGIGTANPLGVLSLVGGQNSIAGLATYSSIEPLGIFNMFYTNSGTYPFYLDIAAYGDPQGSTGGSNIRFLTHPSTLGATPTERMRITSTGAACFACELTAKTLGTNDLILNNLNYECANYVDGTRGSWLIQEGACDLFIINQMSCKKYKFNLIEIK